MTVHVAYFAILREERGCSGETIETTEATALGLYNALRGTHGFSLPADRLKVVINEEFQPWDHALSDGDAVVFIPPVAGG